MSPKPVRTTEGGTAIIKGAGCSRRQAIHQETGKRANSRRAIVEREPRRDEKDGRTAPVLSDKREKSVGTQSVVILFGEVT